MKTLLIVGFAVLATAGVAAADTRPIAVQDLLAIEANGPFRTEITTGPQTSAVLEGSADDLKKIESRVTGSRLQVRTRGIGNDDNIDVVLRVTAPILQAISVSKGQEATAAGLNTTALRLDVSMGGSLDAAGVCNALDVRVRMGGSLDAEHLVCRDVKANASMGGSAHVHATQSIQANASMGGVVEIEGKPPHHDASAMMGGIVDAD